MPEELIRHRWRWPVLWAVVIVVLTSVPGADLPQASPFPEADKVVHFGLYGVFAFLLARAARKPYGGPKVASIIFGIAVFAALDEWHQQFIPGRSMDVRDWVVDVVGAMVGIWIFEMVRKRREQLT